MATNKLELYNLGLTNVSHTKKVQTLTEDSTERRYCEQVYEPSKKAVLAMAKWGFAKRSVALSLTGNDVVGWDYEYYYPNGCVKALEIIKSTLREKRIPYMTASTFDALTSAESRVIWTNQAQASLLYIGNVQNTNMFTPLFDMAVSHHMGITLGRLLSKNSKVPTEMFQMTQYYLAEAIRQNEAEALDEDEPNATWIDEAYN